MPLAPARAGAPPVAPGRRSRLHALIGISTTHEVHERNQIDPKALFRLSVLGPVVSRERLDRGELQPLIRELAQREYAIPGSQRRRVGEKTIQAWYYAWRREGIAGLGPPGPGRSRPIAALCADPAGGAGRQAR